MEKPYGSEWPLEEKIKLREMVAPEARYIFVKQYPDGLLTENSINPDAGVEHMHASCTEVSLLGFVHYRFVVEEELPVVYVYELQMEPCAQGKGLGKFLMQLIEHIACKVLCFYSVSSFQFFFNIILLSRPFFCVNFLHVLV
jgi:N-alpha-acetyltransferase 40